MRILSMKRAKCAIPPSKTFGLRGYCCIVVTLLSSFSGGWRRAGTLAKRSDLPGNPLLPRMQWVEGGASTSGLLGDRTRAQLFLVGDQVYVYKVFLPVNRIEDPPLTHGVFGQTGQVRRNRLVA